MKVELFDSFKINLKKKKCEIIIYKGSKKIKTIDSKNTFEIYYTNQGEIIIIKYFLFKKKIFEEIKYIYPKNNVISFSKIREIPQIFKKSNSKYFSLKFKEVKILSKDMLIAFLNDNFYSIDFIKNLLEENKNWS
jgi:hypothetical protein